MSDLTLDLLLEILGDKEVIAYRPAFGRALGSTSAALFLSQALYWQREVGIDGWFYKLRDAEQDGLGNLLPPSCGYRQSWEWELGGMGRHEQESARRILCREGLLMEKSKGIPKKLYFHVDLQKLCEFILNKQQIADFSRLDGGKAAIKMVEKQPQIQLKNYQADGGFKPSITKTTPKIISENTPTPTHSKGVGVDIEEYVKANLWHAKKTGVVIKSETGFKRGIRGRINESGLDESDEEALQLYDKHKKEAEEKNLKQEQQNNQPKFKKTVTDGKLRNILKIIQTPAQ